MYVFLRTHRFIDWLSTLRDASAKVAITRRIERAVEGNFGDVASLTGGLSEMRVHTGPGYRVYFAKRDSTVYLLLAGGTKSGQQRDIDTARVLWRQIQTRETYDES